MQLNKATPAVTLKNIFFSIFFFASMLIIDAIFIPVLKTDPWEMKDHKNQYIVEVDIMDYGTFFLTNHLASVQHNKKCHKGEETTLQCL